MLGHAHAHLLQQTGCLHAVVCTRTCELVIMLPQQKEKPLATALQMVQHYCNWARWAKFWSSDSGCMKRETLSGVTSLLLEVARS